MSATNNYDKKKKNLVFAKLSFGKRCTRTSTRGACIINGASTKLLMRVKWNFASFSFSIFLQEKMFGIIYRNNTSVEVLDQ